MQRVTVEINKKRSNTRRSRTKMFLTLVRFHQNLTKGAPRFQYFLISTFVESGYADIHSLEVSNFSFRTCQQCYDTEIHKQFGGGGMGGGEKSKKCNIYRIIQYPAILHNIHEFKCKVLCYYLDIVHKYGAVNVVLYKNLRKHQHYNML